MKVKLVLLTVSSFLILISHSYADTVTLSQSDLVNFTYSAGGSSNVSSHTVNSFLNGVAINVTPTVTDGLVSTTAVFQLTSFVSTITVAAGDTFAIVLENSNAKPWKWTMEVWVGGISQGTVWANPPANGFATLSISGLSAGNIAKVVLTMTGKFADDNADAHFFPVAEPIGLTLLGVGLLGIASLRRFKK